MARSRIVPVPNAAARIVAGKWTAATDCFAPKVGAG
jgi:hypothetical protein